jgi:hypothetical protein
VKLDKLDAAIAYIEANPEAHDQNTWLRRHADGEGNWCRTTACLAGTVAILDGWKPTFGPSLGATVQGGSLVEKGGVRDSVWAVAERVLDLTYDEGSALFLEASNLDDIKAIRDDCADQSGEAGERSDTQNASDLGGSS